MKQFYKSAVFFIIFFIGSISIYAIESSYTIIWKNNRPLIYTPRCILRPIQHQDFAFYQKIFRDPTIMKHYLHNVWCYETIERVFNMWLARWEADPFSAFIIMHRLSQETMGHAVLGYTDYDNPYDGAAEIAYIILPEYWNAQYQDIEKNIGTKNMQGIGTEIAIAMIYYAKDLAKKNTLINVSIKNINSDEKEQIHHMIIEGKIRKYQSNDIGEITNIFLPLRKIKATCHPENRGSERILQKIFLQQYGGTVYRSISSQEERDIFEIFIANTFDS